jgi:hypothetical protein
MPAALYNRSADQPPVPVDGEPEYGLARPAAREREMSLMAPQPLVDKACVGIAGAAGDRSAAVACSKRRADDEPHNKRREDQGE